MWFENSFVVSSGKLNVKPLINWQLPLTATIAAPIPLTAKLRCGGSTPEA
jgi:hypothetical protein